MSDESQRPIVIKRIKKGGHGAHGGVWKLAYADFMTAMMAFFLLMWLLGSTSKSDLQGLEGFFEMPIQLTVGPGGNMPSDSIIPEGGGRDLTRRVGANRMTNAAPSKKPSKSDRRAKELAFLEAEKLKAVKKRIEATINQSEFLKEYRKQLLVDLTDEGLRIQIADEQNRPMFASGSAVVQPYAREILHHIGKALNDVNNLVSIAGHTDAAPYSGRANYSNWELSADRANAARRELITGGMKPDRVLRIVGLADAVPYNKDDPFAAINRRISIVVLNQATQDAIVQSSESASEVGNNSANPLAPVVAPTTSPVAPTMANPTGSLEPIDSN